MDPTMTRPSTIRPRKTASSPSPLLTRRRPAAVATADGTWCARTDAFPGSSSDPPTPCVGWKLAESDHPPASCNAAALLATERASTRKLAGAIWRTLMVDGKSGSHHRLQKQVDDSGASLPDFEMVAKRTAETDRTFCLQKLLEYGSATGNSAVSLLEAELEQAYCRITELESERKLSKKKLDSFLQSVTDDKVKHSREHKKLRNMIQSIMDDLHREKKNRHRLEVVNSKLVSDLTEARKLEKRYFQDYEKERKARELMEEVCDELAKEIEQEKAEVEELKAEALKVRKEVEEERRMLQLAEVWREERVQMKLVDAKLMLEHKYSLLNKLQADLMAFLQVQDRGYLEMNRMREAEMLLEAAKLMKSSGVAEFSYQPPAPSEDVFAVFEDLRQRDAAKERGIEDCNGHSVGSCESNVDTLSPETDIFLEKPAERRQCDEEDDNESGWETVSRVEEQGSCYSPYGSEPSMKQRCKGGNDSVSGSEMSGVCSTTAAKGHKGKRSFVRLWRSSNVDEQKKAESVIFGGRLSNGRSNVPLSSRSGEELVLSSPSVAWSPPGKPNACIVQKASLKSKLMEARIESKQIQLRRGRKQRA